MVFWVIETLLLLYMNFQPYIKAKLPFVYDPLLLVEVYQSSSFHRPDYLGFAQNYRQPGSASRHGDRVNRAGVSIILAIFEAAF
jgi:hypothetical protein